MYKTQRKLVIVSVNILAVLLFACLVVFLIPIKSQKSFSVYTLLVVFVVFLAVLFLCNKLKSVLLKYVRKRNLEAGETLLLRNFIDKLRFCYTLDDFYGAISDYLEKQDSIGTILASLSMSAYGKSNALPTALITPLAAIVPKVVICVTESFPYFSVTYSIAR